MWAIRCLVIFKVPTGSAKQHFCPILRTFLADIIWRKHFFQIQSQYQYHYYIFANIFYNMQYSVYGVLRPQQTISSPERYISLNAKGYGQHPYNHPSCPIKLVGNCLRVSTSPVSKAGSDTLPNESAGLRIARHARTWIVFSGVKWCLSLQFGVGWMHHRATPARWTSYCRLIRGGQSCPWGRQSYRRRAQRW